MSKPLYKPGSTFNAPDVATVQNPEKLKAFLADIAVKMNGELRKISRTSAGSQNLEIAESASAGETTSSGSVIEYRSDEKALTAGDNTVTFSTPLSTTRIMLEKIWDSTGLKITDYTISNEVSSGFDINVPQDCTIYYIAMGKR